MSKIHDFAEIDDQPTDVKCEPFACDEEREPIRRFSLRKWNTLCTRPTRRAANRMLPPTPVLEGEGEGVGGEEERYLPSSQKQPETSLGFGGKALHSPQKPHTIFEVVVCSNPTSFF